MKAVIYTKQTGLASLGVICNCFNLQRDAFYKFKKRYNQRKTIESHVIKLVEKERKEQPRVGTRKLHEALQVSFNEANIKIGRDSLFDILREHNMLVKRKKAYCKTTNSYHRFYTYNNLVKDITVIRPN